MPAHQTLLYADCERSLTSTGIGRLEPLRNSNLLITGGTGFVGMWISVLIAYLNDKHRFGIKLTSTARKYSRLADQAEFLSRRDDIKFIPADIRQFIGVPASVNWIVHTAGIPDNRHHATNPIETASVIANGTARILSLAEQSADLRGLLHFSSGLVGNDYVSAAGSSNSPNAPNRMGTGAVYEEAKRFSEALCAAYRTQARLPIIVTRPFTFIGPFQALDAPWAANNFLYAALNDQPLKILGNGESARTYLYGSDMAVLSLHQLVVGKSGETYNLGGSEVVSLRDLASIVIGEVGRPLEIRFNTAARDVGVSKLIPDISEAARGIAFAPAFSLVDAIARTLAWHGLSPKSHLLLQRSVS